MSAFIQKNINKFTEKMKKKRAAKKSAQTLKKQESDNKRMEAEKKGLPIPPSGLAPLRPPDHPPPNPFSDENIKDSAKKANSEGRKSIIGNLTREKVDVGKFLKEQNERRKAIGLIPKAGKINLKKYTTKKRTLGNKDSKNPHAVMFGNPLRGKIGSKKKKKAGKRRRTRKKRKRRRTKKKRRRRRKKRRRTRK